MRIRFVMLFPESALLILRQTSGILNKSGVCSLVYRFDIIGLELAAK
jgi:hypothetical protein